MKCADVFLVYSSTDEVLMFLIVKQLSHYKCD